MLLSAAFVSYVGPFSKQYRQMIMTDHFMKFFKDNKIPMRENLDPLTILTDEATVAGWNNDKLPAD